MTLPVLSLVLILTSAVFGICVAYIMRPKNARFTWLGFMLLAGIPSVMIFFLSQSFGNRLIVFFLVSAVVGTMLEFGVSAAYELVFNEKLWVYRRYGIRGHTSLLSPPVWGIGGVICLLIAKIVGL